MVIQLTQNTGAIRAHVSKTSPSDAANVSFRRLIPHPDHPKLQGLRDSDALQWAELKKQSQEIGYMVERLNFKNVEKPFKGFTTDGLVKGDVFTFAEDEGAPTEAIVSATESLLSLLSEEQQKTTVFESLDADEFRMWSNPELYVNPGGLRLDELGDEIQVAVHNVLKSSFSPAGYEKVLGCCLTNDFLGDLLDAKRVLNLHSYNFRLFGKPSLSKPWGYTFFGHHLCIAVVVYGKRMIIGPTFLGAEPDCIDEGPHAGLRLFITEELLSLKLMQNLPVDLREKATLSKEMEGVKEVDGKMLPDDRRSPHDERHLGGVRQDNRVVPYEGCLVSQFSPQQREYVFDLFKAFNELYPETVLQHRLTNFKAHLDKTYFAWIGEFGNADPYYYRIHSPVAFMELDFHCGVFLTNDAPAKCHIHTINRLPNRGDYGRVLLEHAQKD